MNEEELANAGVDGDSIEGRRSHELVRDEDVLSVELQHALEQVGGGVGVIAAVALFISHLPRAARLLGDMRAKAAPSSGGEP